MMRMRPEVRMECDELSKAPAMALATYHSNSKARLISAVTEDVLGGSTSSSVTTQYSYDALGRPSGQISTASGTGGTLNKVTVTDGYTLQGWLNSHQVKKGTQTLFTETLKYDSPSSTSGGNALYTGLISRKNAWRRMHRQ